MQIVQDCKKETYLLHINPGLSGKPQNINGITETEGLFIDGLPVPFDRQGFDEIWVDRQGFEEI